MQSYTGNLLLGTTLVLATTGGFAAWIARSTFYRALLSREASSARFHAIDGLRGYLAVGVLMHHLSINQQLYRTGVWQLTPSRIDTFLGRGSVAFFFMITAFLFWGRVLDCNSTFESVKFFTSRLRRLVPMYVTSASLVILTALALTHFRILVPAHDLTRQVVSWLLFTIPGAPEINSFGQSTLINTVYWSLTYEWKFYLLLPLFAALARGWAFVVAAGVALWITLFSTAQVEWFFLSGCIAAYAVRIQALRDAAQRAIGTPAALVSTVAAVLLQPMTYTPIGALLLFVPFVVLAAGNSFYGLLTFPAARVLGTLSYSFYLLHNWVLYLVSRLVNHFTPVSDLSAAQYWCVGCLAALITVGLSAFTFRFVEYPWIARLGKARNGYHVEAVQ
ncbi:acyltransferase family protein [Trinickia sp. EG282A]|uniref:acyltransferase family protein n=1 Tax=Trinickia sp. EG282A TaxID=3237013 RepID=UPI0034D2A23D